MYPMKSDTTTKVLLGVIATGVAALTALAFEKRYQACCDATDDLDDSTDHAYDRISRKTREMGHEAREKVGSFKDKVEDGVDALKEKAGQFKDRMGDSLDKVGNHLRDGAEKLKDGLRSGAEEVKDAGAQAAEDAKKAANALKP